MASLEPQGAGKTSPISAFCILSRGMEAGTLILATDGWSCGGRGGSVRCSPIQRGKRAIGGEEWAGREQMGGWEA